MPGFRVSKFFFDRPEVLRAMNVASRGALSKVGAFLRQRARTSMQYSKGPSAPGAPPNAHNPAKLRKFLNFFSAFKSQAYVVVGSEKLTDTTYHGNTPLPRLQEVGGSAPVSGFVKAGGIGKFPARPYMGPALKAEISAGTIPDAWKNSIRKA